MNKETEEALGRAIQGDLDKVDMITIDNEKGDILYAERITKGQIETKPLPGGLRNARRISLWANGHRIYWNLLSAPISRRDSVMIR